LSAALAGIADLPPPGPEARALAEEHLGPVDGQATDRALAVVRKHAAGHRPAARRPTGAQQAEAALRGGAAPILAAGAKAAQLVGRSTEAGALRRRADHWRQHGRELLAIRRHAARRAV
jgi:hypothetical protein